jgi:hypothetical protein
VSTTPPVPPSSPPGMPPEPPARRGGSNRALVVLVVVVVVAAGAGVFVLLSGDDESSPSDEATAETQPDDSSDQPAVESEDSEPAEMTEAEVQALLEGVWFSEAEAGLPVDPDAPPTYGLDTPTFNFCNTTEGAGEEHRVARAVGNWTDLQQRPVFSLQLEVVAYDSEDAVSDFLDAFAAVPETCAGAEQDYGNVTGRVTTAAVIDGPVEGSMGFHMDLEYDDGTWAKVYLLAIPQGRLLALLYVSAEDPAWAESGANDLAPTVAGKLEQAGATYGA